MSGLAALLAGHNHPDVYQWHSAMTVQDIQHAVEHAGWSFRYLDGWTTEDRESFHKGIDAALGLQDGSAEADLASALGSMGAAGAQGTVLLWDGWSPLARHDRGAFDEALQAFRARARSSEGDPVAVVLRGEGPELELQELPLKH